MKEDWKTEDEEVRKNIRATAKKLADDLWNSLTTWEKVKIVIKHKLGMKTWNK